MQNLKEISALIDQTAKEWAIVLACAECEDNFKDEPEKLLEALLYVAVSVLSADEPLNVYESLLLQELFGPHGEVERAQVAALSGANLLSKGLPYLITAVQMFAADSSRYRPERDPVVAVLSAILEAGLAADKFPSEAEAWAASRVLTKLRETALAAPRAVDAGADISTVPANAPVDQSAAFDTPTLEASAPPSSTVGGSAIQSLLTELDALVGLTEVKEQVETLVNLARVKAMRTERGLPSPRISFHLVFSGNPGTGKTSVARIVGKIFGALGLLTVGKCIEVDRAQLIGQYLGQTTTKTTEVLNSALGSVLFVDEAYSLTSGNHNEFGEEAISVILKFMEDHRDDFVLIAAGYTSEMETFLDSNPGLRSRFSRTIDFPDYDLDELVQIFHRMCAADGYVVEAGAGPILRSVIEHKLREEQPNFANARSVRKVYEAALERQANRLAGMQCSDAELCSLAAEDIGT